MDYVSDSNNTVKDTDNCDFNLSDISDICQIDGNISQCYVTKSDTSDKGSQIPVFISQHRTSAKVNSEARIPVRKTGTMELPMVMNLNP